MKRSRMFGDDDPPVGENPSPRTTIVGGRPPERSSTLQNVPTGLQRLLRLAAIDPEFRVRLLERRAGVAEAAGVSLTSTEAAVLGAIPASQLEAMAASLPPPAPPRTDLLRRTAATAVVLLGGAALAQTPACSPSRPVEGPTSDPVPVVESADAGAVAEDAVEAAEAGEVVPAPITVIGGLTTVVDAGEPVPPPVTPIGGMTATDAGGEDAAAEPPPISRGISSEVPPVRPDVRLQAPGGAAPDLPPDRRPR